VFAIKLRKQKIPEKGNVYKTSRVSYISNYALVALAAVLLVMVWPYLNVKIFFTSYADLLPFGIFSAFLLTITFLIEEPAIEQLMRKYVVTNNEVIKIEGLIRRKRISIPHGNVSDIRVKKGVWGRIFNFGDVEVTGFRENIVMKGVRNPDEIYRQVENKVSLMREGFIRRTKGVTFGSERSESPDVESSKEI